MAPKREPSAADDDEGFAEDAIDILGLDGISGGNCRRLFGFWSFDGVVSGYTQADTTTYETVVLVVGRVRRVIRKTNLQSMIRYTVYTVRRKQ